MATILTRINAASAYEVQQKNPLLQLGEPFYELDTGGFKVGNGTQRYNELAYAGIVLSQGAPGEPGEQGPQGEDGLSAYQVAVNNGYAGTEVQWLASLVGPQGAPGHDLDIDYVVASYAGLAGISSPTVGQVAFVQDLDSIYVYDGAAWPAVEDGVVLGGVPGPPGTTSWDGLTDKPAVIAAGATATAARGVISAASTADITAVNSALALKAPLAAPTFTGLLTAETLKITGGSPGVGKVLVSDADGDAAWATPDVTQAELDAKVADSITDGVTGVAPSQNAVYDALALKANKSSPTFTGVAEFAAVKITAGAPGAGKVLTSDADGDATWESPTGGTVPWYKEVIAFSPTIPRQSGYGEGSSGVILSAAVTLTHIMVRLPDWAATIGGTGNLTIDVRKGTRTTEGTSLQTFTLAAGSSGGELAFTTPQAGAKDDVIRVSLTVGSTSGNGLVFELRGYFT